jgi:hypothetical protein
MDLKRVRTFVTVADLGTVSKAALHLHISQSALSRQISDLEDDCGFKLFDRIGRRLFLTTLASSCSAIVAAYWVNGGPSGNESSCFGEKAPACSNSPRRRRQSRASWRDSCHDTPRTSPTCA